MTLLQEADVRIRTLVMTDLVGSTHLTQALGEARAASIFALHERLARDLLVTAGGWEIDKADGFLLLFEDPFAAVRFALDYHGALLDLSSRQKIRLEARVAIHQGKVLLRRNPPEHVARGAKPIEVEGLAKPVTARLMQVAARCQTLLTLSALRSLREDESRRRACLPADLSWRAHGRYQLHGLRKPILVFEVGVQGQAPLSRPRDTTKVRASEMDRTIPVLHVV